ncbi:D-hexose-6-phosphate mutarotase [Algisphaera agarilytica]|uniref:Putative glucose-6-phosphate 1-epimerase n=1 Tax=Algisphaera agarilytica TaxID=1385975 RepID=A0A7X0H6A9_9BACT|nr:D-hexose-6-phosphate mutarotase [Algisphaera agarilytica]MBB6429847.1 glucose-6-phosphate 1-epimerase [Algisphaera agarilytica]
MPESILERAEEFSLPEALTVQPGEGELPRLRVETDHCSGAQYLHGATVTDWKPAGEEPVLFTSAHAVYRDGKAIRGGVPICFPWFGPHPTDPSAPAHGLVRTIPWRLTQTAQGPAGVETQMVTTLDQLHADYRVTFGKQLTLNLTVTNIADTDQTFEAALHTYFRVGDAREVTIAGLEYTRFIDKLQDMKVCDQGEHPVTFTAETDRVYVDTQATCVLNDPVMNRKIKVEKLGSLSTVVWNPWIGKSQSTADFGDDEWTGMCCIESANIGDEAVSLAPGASHTLLVKLSVETL